MKTEITPANDAIDLPSQIERRRNTLTASELSGLVHLSSKQIYALAAKGILPHYRIGGSIRFDPVRTAKWLRDRAA